MRTMNMAAALVLAAGTAWSQDREPERRPPPKGKEECACGHPHEKPPGEAPRPPQEGERRDRRPEGAPPAEGARADRRPEGERRPEGAPRPERRCDHVCPEHPARGGDVRPPRPPQPPPRPEGACACECHRKARGEGADRPRPPRPAGEGEERRREEPRPAPQGERREGERRDR